MPARALWIITGTVFAAWLGLGFAALVVHDRQERCVRIVLKAHGAGLSTWEALERCGKIPTSGKP